MNKETLTGAAVNNPKDTWVDLERLFEVQDQIWKLLYGEQKALIKERDELYKKLLDELRAVNQTETKWKCQSCGSPVEAPSDCAIPGQSCTCCTKCTEKCPLP